MSGSTLRRPRIRETRTHCSSERRQGIASKTTARGLYAVSGADRDFLSTVSRELRPRLAVIARHCGILLNGRVGELTDVQAEKVEVIDSRADKMAEELETVAWGLSVMDDLGGDYFAILTQQLREHLAIIKGYADALQCGDLGELSGPQVEMAKVINACSDKMRGILDELLDVDALQRSYSVKGIWSDPSREEMGRMVCKVSNL